MTATTRRDRLGTVLTFAAAWVTLAAFGYSAEAAPVVAGLVAQLMRGH